MLGLVAMYADKSLVSTEAVRLAALGRLMSGPVTYSDLAQDIRYFTARIVGPSLDLLGSSLELLHLEGLIEPISGKSVKDDTELRITDGGKALFLDLMDANLKTPLDDTGRLVMALKLRFLFLLNTDGQLDQIDLLREIAEIELARLEDLQKSHGEGALAQSLELDIDEKRARIAWLNKLEDELENAA